MENEKAVMETEQVQQHEQPVQEAPAPEVDENKNYKRHHHFLSKPLFKQSFKANWILWLVMSIGCAAIFIVINIVVGSKNIFTNIDMNEVTVYVKDEGLSWLQILGLLEKMGFSLSRIQVMSQIDLNAIMNDLIYKIAGVLLPMIYVMTVSNKLVASQVNDGFTSSFPGSSQRVSPSSSSTVVREEMDLLEKNLRRISFRALFMTRRQKVSMELFCALNRGSRLAIAIHSSCRMSSS